MDHDADPRPRRGTFLSILLTLLFWTALHLIFYAACGGLGLAIVALVIGIALVGFLHYFLWGRSLNHEVVGEREEDDLRAEFETNHLVPEEQTDKPRS